MNLHRSIAPVASSILCLPAALMVGCGLLHSVFEIERANAWIDTCIAHPWLGLFFTPWYILGGPVIILAMQARKLFRVIHPFEESGPSELGLALRVDGWRLALFGIAGMLTATILAYGVVENFEILPR